MTRTSQRTRKRPTGEDEEDSVSLDLNAVRAVDLNAARAARREAQKKAPEVILDEATFTMPIEMPFAVVEKLGDMAEAQQAGNNAAVAAAVMGVIRILFGDQYDEFMKHRPSMGDLEVLLDGLLREYGFNDSGESQASESSSANTSTP
jgi:hypothetical protein